MLNTFTRPGDSRRWRKPDAEFEPTKLTCEVYSCPVHGTKQTVLGVWDQPAHFVDPSTIYLLACGHEVL